MDEVLLREYVTRFKTRFPDDESIIESVQNWLIGSRLYQRLTINPYHIVRGTEIPIEALTPVLLRAVTFGLFDLFWDVRCPHCNMATAEYSNLFEITHRSTCEMCDIEFEVDFLERVEISFSLNRAVEDMGLQPTCFPPPGLKSKVVILIPEGETSSGEGDFSDAGLYRYFCPLTTSKGLLNIEGEPTDEVQVRSLRQLVGGGFVPDRVDARPGQVKLEVTNEGYPLSGMIVCKDYLPLLDFKNMPARMSGLELIHYPEYRALFGNQVLSDRERIHISSVTTMFTDITGSTRLYKDVGDAQAYNLVRTHFDILFAAIEEHQGTVVKTIGDAVMASFLRNADGLRCALKIQEQFQAYNESHPTHEQLYLKISLHYGPSVLVNLNGRLDYFGSTINDAANIQNHVSSGQIALSAQVYEDSSITALLEEQKVEVTIEEVALKATTEKQALYKIS